MMNTKVDFFFEKAKTWKDEYAVLRKNMLDCGLTEELKWGTPCYTFEGKNIVLIHGFKEYCALLFFKGALMKDPKKILIQQTKNVQAQRQIRFTSLQQVNKLKSVINAYVFEAVKIEESGAKVVFRTTSEFAMPDEFKIRLSKDRTLKKAFESLTPGRQRGYLLHFSSAKQAKTREARVEKNISNILDGKGLED